MTAFYCDAADVPNASCYEESYTCAETGEPCTTTLVTCPAEDGPCTQKFVSAYYTPEGTHMVDTEICHDGTPNCDQYSCEGYECMIPDLM